MGGVILSFFQLILRVPFKLALDAIDKGLGVSKVFFKDSLELWPCDWNGTLVTALVLGPSKADGTAKEYGGK